MPKLALAALFALALLLAAAPCANAGVVSFTTEYLAPMADQPDRYCEEWSNNFCYGAPQERLVIRYVAKPGEVNDVSTSADGWTIRDRGAPIEIADPRCEHVDGDQQAVSCGSLWRYPDYTSIAVDLGDGDDRLDGTYVLTDVEGGEGDDELVGTSGRSDRGELNGGPGNDVIRAHYGNGGPGNDRLEGNHPYGNALLSGGTGDDVLHTGRLCGGSWEIRKQYYYVGLPDRPTQEGYNMSWECVAGDDGNDTLTAGPNDHEVDMHGGDGADVLRGGPAADRMNGGAGNDRIYATGAVEPYWIDFVTAGPGNDFIDSRNGDSDQIDDCGEGIDEWIRDPWDYSWGVRDGDCETVDPTLPDDGTVPPPQLDPLPAPLPDPLPPVAEDPPPAVKRAQLERDGRLTLELSCRATTDCRGTAEVSAPGPTSAGRRASAPASRKYAVSARERRKLRVKLPRALARSISSNRRAKISLVTKAGTSSKTVRVRVAKPR